MNMSADKMVFINLTEMKRYCGPEENLSGGGAYVDQKGFGHELFNFKVDDGYCYGYTTPYCKLKLGRISSNINTDALGDYIDNVLVVFTGSREGKGRVIVGWYKDSRIYSKSVSDKRQSRYLEIDSYVGYIDYNIISSAENATLIDYKDRDCIIPHSKLNDGIGYGQYPIWYADKENALPCRNEVARYIFEYE